MWNSVAKVTLGAALGSAAVSACAADTGEWPEGAAPRLEREEDVGAASRASTPVYCIRNAHTDQGTVHFHGPNWLLSASEGLGPQELHVYVHEIVNPAISVSDTVKLDSGAVSAAVGYGLAARYEVTGGARLEVPRSLFQRLEAYTAFQRTVWEVRDASCSVILGTAASFQPIGVFFRTVDTVDVRLPDTGVFFAGGEPGAAMPVLPGLGLGDAGAPGPGGPDGG